MFEDVGSASTSSSNNSSSSNADRLKKGPWTAAEDAVLMAYVNEHGEGNWNHVHKYSGLARCGKSCRLRWANHLRPNLKKGAFTPDEERLIIHLHSSLGNKWARMASMMPGRTDNEIKNYWNTRIKRRLRAGLSIYPPDLGQPNSLGEMNIKLSGQSSFGKSLMQNNVPLNNNPEQERMNMKSASEGSKHKTVSACELPSSQRDTKICKEASSRMPRMSDSRVYQAREIDKQEFAELDAVVPNAMNMNSSVWAHDSRHDTLDFCVFYAAHNMPSLKSSGIKMENRILRNPECSEEDIGTLIEFTKPCEEQQHNNIPAADWYSSSPLVRNYDAIHLYDTAAPQNDVRIGADSTPMMQNSQYYYHAACDVLGSFPWTNMHAASD